MTTNQYSTILSLYKKLQSTGFISELENKLLQAKKDLDKSFTLSGKEDASINEYINELLELQDLCNEQRV